jgi:hypothetical protein
MEGFDGPPESYLPKIEPVNEIDQEIMDQLKIMGFIHSVVRPRLRLCNRRPIDPHLFFLLIP